MTYFPNVRVFIHGIICCTMEFLIEFEPASLQTQIPFNVQAKVQFKIPRTRNRLNPEKTKFGPKNITQIKQS